MTVASETDQLIMAEVEARQAEEAPQKQEKEQKEELPQKKQEKNSALNKKNSTPVNDIAESEPIGKTEQDNDKSEHTKEAKLKRRKRKHRKAKPARDSEEVREIRVERFKAKREGLWNARFINDTIPDLFAGKARRRKSEGPARRNKSPLQTVYLDKDLGRHRLPQISQKEHKQTQKSFQIRTVAHKRNKKPLRDSEPQEQQPEQARTKGVDKAREAAAELRIRLEEKSGVHRIPDHYKVMLLELIEGLVGRKSRELRRALQEEISSIGEERNSCAVIEGLIAERAKGLREIREKGGEANYGQHLQLQLTSIALVEEILRFKAKWEEHYFRLEQPKRVSYLHQGTNYFLTMRKQGTGEGAGEGGEDDPFLVARTADLQVLAAGAMKEQEKRERQEMVLKIRACELLLIEEELLG